MRALWGLLLGLMLLGAARGQEVTSDLVRSVLEDAECQSSLPGDEGTIVIGTSNSSETTAPAERGLRLGGGSLFGGGFAKFLLWVFLAIVVAIFIATFVRSRRNVEPRPRSRAAPVNVVPDGRPAEQTLPEYEPLADAGDFAGAVHAVLQHAFAFCAKSIGGLPAHATGRQVLRLAKDKQLSTDDLRELVSAVERVHFGGAIADRQLYEVAKQRLRAWEAVCQER